MQNFFCKTSLVMLIGTASVHAQKTAIYTHELKDFYRGVELYQEKQYQSALELFRMTSASTDKFEIQSDCAYYIAQCAIRLGQSNGDVLMENFIANYPTSAKHNQAYLEVAHFYFEENQFPKALEWFEKVNESNLTVEEREKFNFQKGYAYFHAKEGEKAKNHLTKVVNSPKYGSQAKFYLGFISYEGDNFAEANQYFDQVGDEKKYKDKMSYYQADMNFKLGNFEKAIELSQIAMAKADAVEKSELNKIIGESYFNLKKYQEAIPFLKLYKGKKGKWNNTDFYMLGYAHYQQKDYENAISQFNKIIDGADFVAQNAYYHLGESYLNTNQKPQSLNAFKNASEMDFDAKIQEDAALNYAKLSYEIGNPYQSVPDVLSSFLKKYPNSPSKQELESLLINSYITSRNYKEALVLLEKNNSFQNKVAYQKVTFYRGMEIYTDGDYQQALAMFKKSLSEPRDPKFTARATFWKGETEFGLDNFQESLLSFKQFQGSAEAKNTPEFKNIHYNIGYAYFKLKDYDNAATSFQTFLDLVKNDKVRTNDAYLRMGDSYFVSAKYWPAMEAYNKAIDLNGVDADYAAFQKAISYGFVSRNDKKIEDLNAFIKKFTKSQYRDDAFFELGNTYTNQGNDDLAIKTYDLLVNEFKTSSFAARAILRQGLIYYNSNKSDLALQKFKKVVADFPRTPESVEAVATARQIYVDKGQVDVYASWVKTLDFIEISDNEIDQTTYESAEKMYLQNNAKGAIAGFSSYLSQFPRGNHVLKASFYLAQLYFADGLENNAIEHYEFVIAQNRNEFTEQALARLSEIYLKKKDFGNAVPVLKRLEQEADYPQNKMFAQSNLMKAYYEQQDFSKSVQYADLVLANPKIDDRVRSDAQIIVARAAIKTGNEAKAKESYAKLLTIAKGELAAEAIYYDAYFKNKEGKFDASNDAVQKIIKEYSGYKYYLLKGLILMSRNSYATQDYHSAIHLLENIMPNTVDFKDLNEEAKAVLQEFKAEQAKQNADIKN